MQFDYQHKVGTDYSTVKFKDNYLTIPYQVRDKLFIYFQRLGGVLAIDGIWIFPSFISSVVIAQVIHNTCFVCGGLMKDDVAIINTDVYSEPDAVGKITVYSGAGEAKRIKVRKCQSCGHSHT